MKKLALLLVCSLLLTGCAADSFLSMLGFDVYNYRAEKTVATLAADDETALRLTEFISGMLLLSPYMTPFYGVREAADCYRDAVLAHMLGENFARYAGNSVLLEEAREAYPYMQLQILIPAADLETQMYSLFNGTERITHHSGELFEYLPDMEAYTAATVPDFAKISVDVIRCEETERTYRLWFYNTLDTLTPAEYFALFVKRDDGTIYCKQIENV